MLSIPVIVWDVDDVLNSLMQDWFEKSWLPMHPSCELCYEDLVENPPHKLLGVSLQNYLESLDAFRLSAGFSMMQPNIEVMNWFERYGDQFHHLALTATPVCAASASSAWLFRYFGRWFRSFHFTPSARDTDIDMNLFGTKQNYLQWLNKGDFMVEDNANNAKEAQIAGLNVVMMPQPWNHCEGDFTCALSKLTDNLTHE